MKYPILYRIVLYGCVIILGIVVLTSTHLMRQAPFSSSDMRLAYYAGCNLGARPLTDQKVAECYKISMLYKEMLDYIDKQMERFK